MTDTSPAPNSARNLLEAGDLSRLLSRVEIESALARREAVLRATSRAAERFLSGNWRDFVLDSMRELGLGADVSRVFLFDNRPNDEGQTRHYQIYEWCASGIEPHINDPELQDFELKDIGLERWKDELGNDRVVQGIVAQFPENERPILEALQVQSIIVVPVTVNGRWWGCFGFEECRQERHWKEIEIECLRLSADILAAAIGREASDMALRDSEGEMAALFNAMRDPVFVIDKNGVYRKVFACDETLLALPPSELLGRSLSDIFETEVARQFQSALDM